MGSSSIRRVSGTREVRPNSRTRILELAVAAIDRGGEPAVRVSEISAAAETAVTSLYHHFGSREGLIEEAHVERMIRGYRVGTEEFRQASVECRSRAQFRALVLRMTREASSSERRMMRLARANAVGSAFGRPNLFRRITDVLERIEIDRAEVLAMAQRRGWLRADIDPRAVSAWYSSVVFGRALVDFERPSCDGPAWLALTIEALDHIGFGPEAPRGRKTSACDAGGPAAGGDRERARAKKEAKPRGKPAGRGGRSAGDPVAIGTRAGRKAVPGPRGGR